MKVVLLPGLDGTGTLFEPFIEALSGEFVVQVISYPASVELSYPELVEYVLSKIPKDDFVLVGESFSGPITYQVALRKPKNLVAVVFVATFLTTPRRFLLGLACSFPTRLLFSLPVPKLVLKKYLLGPDVAEEVINLFNRSLSLVSPALLSFRLREIAKLETGRDRCDVQAIYIQATDDRLVPESSVASFEKVCKDLSVIRVVGAHFILQTKPLACAEVLGSKMRAMVSEDFT